LRGVAGLHGSEPAFEKEKNRRKAITHGGAAPDAQEALECLRNETAMVLLAAAQAADLRTATVSLGTRNRRVHNAIRHVSDFLDRDRAMEQDVADVASLIAAGKLAV
jgi:histidine ammonia-lyase/phenylalanine ammonia-lyase